MARRDKTETIIAAAASVLEAQNPMTLRQVYYQLVSQQIIPNCRSAYQALSGALVAARQEGTIPWEWIEDRTRRPRAVSMWTDLPEFLEDVRNAYRRDVWQTQPQYVEAWLEKDALSGLFGDVLRPYGITLNVGRGYDGWSSIRNAALRIEQSRKPTAILYFGDFDPSGEDMARSLRERLAFFSCEPEIVKCALIPEDIGDYSLPPAFNKKTDSREKAFSAQYGETASVELDALPWTVLKGRIVDEVEHRMDLKVLKATVAKQKEDADALSRMIDAAGRAK
jgi:hypothetical protein